jgi:hypothetical protein
MFSKSIFDSKIPSFIDFLSDRNCREDYLLYEIQESWKSNWNLENSDLTKTYDVSLKSKISNRLWRTHDYEPKDMMIHLMSFDKEMIRYIFKDLFNETKPIDLKIQRFIYHCDQIFTEYRKVNQNQKLRSHYQDHFIISVYLFLNNPKKYLLFSEPKFISAMTSLGARNIKAPVSTESYYKTGAILGKFLGENKNLMDVVKSKLTERKINFSESNAIANIFIEWLAAENK